MILHHLMLKKNLGWVLQLRDILQNGIYLLASFAFFLFQSLSAELQKLHADIGDKKDALLKSITSVGGDPERFSQCFRNLQAWLQVTEAAATSRNNSMKAELDGYSNYQVQPS